MTGIAGLSGPPGQVNENLRPQASQMRCTSQPTSHLQVAHANEAP